MINPFPEGDPFNAWQVPSLLAQASSDDGAAPIRARPSAPGGLTLVELVIVVAILAIVAGFIIPRVGNLGSYSRVKAAKATLVQLANAIQGTPDKPGYVSDVGHPPNNLNDLFNPNGATLFNRDTNRGWREPYMLNGSSVVDLTKIDASLKGASPHDYVALNDQTLFDPWGNPFIIQRIEVHADGNAYLYKRDGTTFPLGATALPVGDYSRLISAGPGGTLDTPAPSNSTGDLLPLRPARFDDIVVFLSQPDPDPAPRNGPSDPDLGQ